MHLGIRLHMDGGTCPMTNLSVVPELEMVDLEWSMPIDNGRREVTEYGSQNFDTSLIDDLNRPFIGRRYND